PLIDAVGRRLGAADPGLGEIASIARLVSDLREAGSAVIIPIGPGIRQGRAMTVDELYRMERGLGAFDALRGRLRFMATAGDEGGRIRRAYNEIERTALEEPRARVMAVVAESKAGRPYSVTGAEWSAVAADRLVLMSAVREAALAELAE